MSAQAAYASPLRAERGGLAATHAPVAKMSFYDLQNLFWQLDASERFSGTETRLYFYWLNRLNAGLAGEYWPDEYPRWGKQVEADLGLTDKTLAVARVALVKRGLLSYREGTKSRAALWGLGKIARNNSGQCEAIATNMSRKDSDQSAISRKDSGQPEAIAPHMGRNNSGESDAIPPNMSRNNSGLYKEKTEDLNNDKDKDPTVAAGAAALVEVVEAVEVFDSSLEAQAPASHTEGGAADVATSIPKSKPAKVAPEEAPAFLAFWQAYPRHEHKVKAAQSFARLKPEEQAQATALAPAFFARRTDWISPEGTDYRPHAATWLNGKRWKEMAEPQPTPITAPSQVSQRKANSAELRARYAVKPN